MIDIGGEFTVEAVVLVALRDDLDDGHGKTVAVRPGVCHGGSAYPDPLKATQPEILLHYGWA